MWQLFLQTGDVETYLLFKQLENELDDTEVESEDMADEYALFKTKM